MRLARLCRGIAILCALGPPFWAGSGVAQQTPPAISLAVTSTSSYTALPSYGAPNNPYALFVNDGLVELSFALGQAGKTAPVVSASGSTGPQQATFVADLNGTTMTVSSVLSGAIGLNQLVSGVGITPGTTISALGTGTGGIGTYTLSGAATTGTGVSIGAFSPLPTIEAGGCRVINVGTGGGYVAAATASGSTTLRITTQLAGPTSPSCPGAAGSGVISGAVTTVPATMSGSPPTTVSIPAATATNVIAAGTYKHACLNNSGTGQAWWSYGTAVGSPATASSFPMAPAGGAGQQGGGFCWDGGGATPTNGVNVYSTAGTTVVVETGN